ncbi:FAD binding domain-containing protein [Cellulosilyticum sp. I15G10I2]|uniref:FAD binding domain-containing protein n=1 Tax=Cellulosilyticum sp. I15G10I2 TaxID=1892843 RepID=UPI00085C7361|nr:FAD binding domain-containing protein [Cellulosilyticum sp. I15G10I2]
MVKAFRPSTLEEALAIINKYKVLLYAGGTDCMVHETSHFPVLFLNYLAEISKVNEDEDHLYIGSMCTYDTLLKQDSTPEILKQAMGQIASPAIRNVGTIGGNICNASPAGDTLPVLYALHASIKLVSMHSSRVIKIEDFITGPKRTDIKHNEILETIIVPKQSFNKMYYKKVGARKADAISKLSFVGLMQVTDGVIKDMRVAIGAAAPTVVKDREIEQECIGRTLSEVVHDKEVFLDRYKAIITPIDDQRSTAYYRKKIGLRLIEDFMVTSSL